MRDKIKDENYITIQAFMVKELGLKGNALIIYACIYGFSQAENQVFNGSLQYLADWTNSTKAGVINALKTLIEKGYIAKNEAYFNGVKIVEYYATKFNTPLKKVEWGYSTKFNGGIQKSLTNNIDDNLTDNIVDNREVRSPRFSKPTVEEITAYCKERGNHIDAQQFFDFYESKGWKVGNQSMKDWKACVRTWERRDKKTDSQHIGGIDIEKHEYSADEINNFYTVIDDEEI